MLVTEPTYNCPVYTVTFESKARTHWHSHPGGQILLITGGKGFYQEEGKEAQKLQPGDVVKIPPDVKHWHGVSNSNWFIHVGMSTNLNLGDAEWFGPVTDEEYSTVNQ